MSTTILRKPGVLEVRIDQRLVALRFGATCSHGTDQRTATATIEVPEKPEWATVWSEVDIRMSAAGQAPLRFRGYVVGFDYTDWPRTVVIQCRGPLAKAEAHRQSSGGVSFANSGLGTPDEEQVEAVLLDCGITAMSIHGTGEPIGSIATDQVIWEDGQSGLEYIHRLDEVSLGHRTYDAPGGTVLRRQIFPRPTAGSVATFEEGVDIERGSSNRTVLDVHNRVRVIGYDTGTGPVMATSQQASTILPPGTGDYSTFEFSSPLIEREAPSDPGAGLAAQDVADWLLAERHQQRIKVSFTTPRDDQLFPGATITVRRDQSSQLPGRLGDTRNYWVQNVSYTVDSSGFRMDIIALGGIGSSAPIERPPVVDFSMFMEVEEVLLGSETTLYVTYVESAAVGQSGAIIREDWTVTGGVDVYPTSGSGRTFTFVSTDLTATITLEVEDSGGNIGTLTKAIADIPVEERRYRRLYDSAEVAAEAFDGTTWRTAAPSAGLVAKNANGPFWRTNGSKILVSYDDLATAPTEYEPFSDPVANVTAIAGDTDATDRNIIVGSSDGRMALSTSGGTSWTVRQTPATVPVIGVHISGFSTNHWFALTASHLYESHDGGVTWVTLATTQTGEVFRQYAPGRNRNLLITEAGRLVFDVNSGVVHTFDGPPPGDIASITPAIRYDGFYLIDGNGDCWAHATDGATVFEQRSSIPSGEPQTEAIHRDGDIPDLIYAALGTGGVWKSIDGFRTADGWYQLRAPGAGNASALAVYRDVGSHGNLSAEPFVAGTVLYYGDWGVAVRQGPNNWLLWTSTPFDRVERMWSPAGNPSRLWVRGRVAGTANTIGLWTSVDSGQTWNVVSMPGGAPASACSDIHFPAGQTSIAYMAVMDGGSSTTYGGVYKSTDGGGTWPTKLSMGDANGGFRGARSARTAGTRLAVAQLQSSNAEGWWSDDDGTTQTAVDLPTLGGAGNARLILSPDAPGTIIGIKPETASQQLSAHAVSGGTNTNITPSAALTGLTVPSVRGVNATGQLVLIAHVCENSTPSRAVLCRSTDGGLNWSVVLDDSANFQGGDIVSQMYVISRDPTTPGIVWAAGSSGDGHHVWHSDDDGVTWTAEICNVASGIRYGMLVTG
jgi:hypothetical protein